MNSLDCVYGETAPPFAHAGALQGPQTCDVAIVGAGFTGLAAALHLAGQRKRVVVLDRHGPGWGASGRNGGQVNPGLKPDPDQIGGTERVRAAWSAPDLVFDLIDRHGIACDAVRGGTLRVASSPRDLLGLRSLGEQLTAHGIDTGFLDRASVASRIGGGSYAAGLLDRRGGQINPLAFARGLARAAADSGARIHGDSPALSLTRTVAGWRIALPGGTLDSGHVLLATNGYTDRLMPKLRRSIVPVHSAIIASAPLPERARASILAEREVVYELGRITTYYRVDSAGRLLIGGRSRSRPLAGAESFGFLSDHARRLWPQSADWRWTHGWNGQLAMTVDHLPHLHQPAPGLFACLGYNGRGVAMATLLGSEVAGRICGTAPETMVSRRTPIRPIPLHGLWPLGVAVRILQGRLSDHWDRARSR